MILFDNLLYCQMMHDFCLDFWASLRVLLFYICFCSLIINTRLVFISYLVSVPLRKDHRGLEYQCSFVRLYLFLFAFLIICIEAFCIFDYLYRLLVFGRFFITKERSTGGNLWKSVHENFANLTGKQLCWNLSLIKLEVLRPPTQVFPLTFAKI